MRSPIKLSISNSMLLYTIVVAILSFFIVGYLWITTSYKEFRTEKQTIRKRYIANQKARIKNEVDRVIAFIAYMRSQTEKRLKKDIRHRTYEAVAIATHLYEKQAPTKPLPEIEILIKEALRPIRYNKGRGYYFATKMNGVEALFADRPDLENRNLIDMQDTKGKYVIQDMIQIAREKGEGFYTYTWTKPNSPGRDYPKIAFIKYFEPFDWFIGTGEYLDDVTRDIQEEVLQRIETIRFGKDGYIFAGQWDGLSLCGPAKGRNMYDVTDAEGKPIVQELIAAAKNGGGFVTYILPKFEAGQAAKKLSYANGFPDWEWYVGTGVFIDEIEAVVQDMEQQKNIALRTHILKILGMLLILLCIVMFIVRFIASRVRNNLRALMDFFDRVSQRSFKIDPKELHFPEFAKLAVAANKMVDARYQAEQALRQSEAQLRTIFDAAKDIAFIIINTENDSLPVTEFSPGASLIFGFSRREIIGKPLAELQLPLNLFGLSTVHNNEWGANERFSGEFLAKRKTGDTFPALLSTYPLSDEHNVLIAFLIVCIDMTEQKRAQEARIRFETVVEQAAELILITDPDGIIQYVNPAFEKTTGYARQEVLGKNPRLLNSGQQSLEFYQNMWRTISTGNVWQGHITNKKKDGALLEEEATISPIRDNNGTIINYVGIKRDVTREVRLEKQLLQTQKMEAIGTLAGGIAHDFNNILSAIIGYSEIVMQDLPESDKSREHLQKVLTAGDRARELVKQILAFSRQSEIVPKPLQVKPIAKEVLKLLRASLPATIEIRKNFKTDAAILADPTQVHQVFMNLCTNAAHAMQPDGGTLTITVSDVHIDTDFASQFANVSPGPFIHIAIQDSGHGMEPEILDRIFDPFFTTKKMGEGTGMGLSVVHGIVSNHGGAITVDSRPGKGTAFHVYFPLIENAADKQKVSSRHLPIGSERILFVDDEIFQGDLAKQMLERLGYTIVICADSKTALKIFGNAPDDFDLVITDMTMPYMTGDVLSEKLIAIRPDIPIILCTGYSERMTEEKAKAIGIKAFALKPVLMEKLAGMIRDVLDNKI